MTPVLEVEGLVVEMRRDRRAFHAVDGVSFALERGGALAIVGESGCGKSLTLRAIMGLLPNRGRLASGRVIVDGVTLPAAARGRGRGHNQQRRMSIVFQDPLSALNPVATVGAAPRGREHSSSCGSSGFPIRSAVTTPIRTSYRAVRASAS